MKWWNPFTWFRKRSHQRTSSREAASNLPFPYLMRVPDIGDLKTRYNLDHKYYFVHVTAGWQNQTATSFLRNFLERGLCTDFMEEDGQIFVHRNWNRGGSHLGKGYLMNNPHGKKIHSKDGAGIEIACGGKLEVKNGKLYTWFGKPVGYENAYKLDGLWYEKMTEKQIKSLARYLKDIARKHQGIIFLSHDEVSGYRGKTDVGGCLGMPFGKFLEEYVYES